VFEKDFKFNVLLSVLVFWSSLLLRIMTINLARFWKTTNQKTAFSVCNVLIGWFWNMNTKVVS